MSGYKFRRQHSIGPFFADFACPQRRLIIELDRGQHTDQIEEDWLRTEYLLRAGWRVIRFWDHDVLNGSEMVLETIFAVLASPSPQPSLRGWGERVASSASMRALPRPRRGSGLG